jgi:hypothetical protein
LGEREGEACGERVVREEREEEEAEEGDEEEEETKGGEEEEVEEEEEEMGLSKEFSDDAALAFLPAR